jgi:hypothetical protein
VYHDDLGMGISRRKYSISINFLETNMKKKLNRKDERRNRKQTCIPPLSLAARFADRGASRGGYVSSLLYSTFVLVNAVASDAICSHLRCMSFDGI